MSPTRRSTASKWRMDSFVYDIVTEEYTKKDKQEFIQKSLNLLKDNFIKTLEDWSDMPTIDMNKYPDGLKILLNNACPPKGKSINI